MLYVSLLGEQAITEDGTSVQARSSRAVALVAFLAAHAGAPQSRQRIAGMFWPESTDAQALANLRRELYHLRQILAIGERPGEHLGPEWVRPEGERGDHAEITAAAADSPVLRFANSPPFTTDRC